MLNNLVERLLATDLTDKERIDKGIELKVSDIHYAGNVVHGIIPGIKRTHVVALNVREGSYLCSCEDFSYRHKFCKHIIALIKDLPDDVANEFMGSLELLISLMKKR